jgi:type IV fimbrial biogenesis protein FimT
MTMSRVRLAAATGLTLIELMIALSVVAVLALVAAPSVRDMILMQRLRAINAQLVTDLQFARSEAASRSQVVRVVLEQNTTQTCYALFTSRSNALRCSCLNGVNSACSSGLTSEIRTVVVPRSMGVTVLPLSGQPDAFGFDPATGGLISIPSDTVSSPLAAAQLESRIDEARRLRTLLNQAGRPTVCAPDSATMQVTAC